MCRCNSDYNGGKLSQRLVIFPLLLALAGCGSKPQAAATTVIKKKLFEVPPSAEADEMAKFLAGVKGSQDPKLVELQSTQHWKDHAREFDAIWSKFNQDRRPKLAGFQKSELSGAAFSRETVFYPFGGPDILTPTIFFPSAKTFILVGLEPPGTVPGKDAVAKLDPGKYLPGFRRAVYSLLYKSFFVTETMDHQLRGQVTDGVLTPLLIELARTNNKILGHQHVLVNTEGKMVARELKNEPPTTRKNYGIAIEFQPEGSAESRMLIYFSVNLHNSAFKENEAFRKFIRDQAPVATFFKAASYLPHSEMFSIVREFVQEVSSGVIQDDTGIPYRFWDKTKWDLQLYGKYTQPYGSFKYRIQKDLKQAFEEDSTVKPLGFFIGYGYGRSPSWLVRATKK